MKCLSGQIIWSILGILCMIYGLFVSRSGSGTGFFLVWIAMGIAALLLASVCRLQLWSRLPAAVRTAVLVCGIIFLTAFAVVEGKILSRFQCGGRPDLDYVIVLGAQVYDYGPSKVLKCRLDTAADYLRENDRTICIVSGGQGFNEPAPEAEIMKQYLIDLGIDPQRIVVETESKNTMENIRNSFCLINPEQDTVGIVTNNFHVFRSCAIAEKAGLRHVSGIAAPSNRFYLPNNLLREYFGTVKDILAGHMKF